MKSPIVLNGTTLTVEQVVEVAQQYRSIALDATALDKVNHSQQFIQQQVDNDEIVYGVTTGFGINVDVNIKGQDAIDVQRYLLISHACGVGDNFSTILVRAIMLIRLNTLLRGYSGIRVSTVELLAEFINKRVHPIIPSQGSVGASGDLCPLCHMAIALIGEGYAEIDGRILAGEALRAALHNKGIQPTSLVHKEGLALINGTTVMAALGVEGTWKASRLLKLATLTSCLVYEAIGARAQFFDSRVDAVRNHEGQRQIAAWIRTFTKHSSLVGIPPNHILAQIPNSVRQSLPSNVQQELDAVLNGRAKRFSTAFYKHFPLERGAWETLIRFAERKLIPQDSYSIRCIPQVLGASWQAIQHVNSVVSNELNAVVDNPLVFWEQQDILSAGNFHGQPLALVLDYLKLALAEVGNILERQINKLVDPHTNDLLPGFLAENRGLYSGMMLPQYVAAGLVSENKVLVHPASADSIPTCANQEDHVSMGTIAGRQALEILGNVEKILAISMMTAAQAVDMRRKQFEEVNLEQPELGAGTKQLYDLIRKHVAYIAEDRFLYDDIQAVLKHMDVFYDLAQEL